MRSLISEFSYGFALTHELVLTLGSLSAAPIFPSLIEEGRSGGGYDVKLEAPGVPLFLQFKRSECMQRRSAREIRRGASLDVPFYRIEITASADSDQHEMLLELDQAPNLVFYAAPMFYQKHEFDDAFLKGRVRHRSFYVRPRAIGAFADEDAHYVSFDGSTYVAMSEPRRIEGHGIAELEAALREQLDADRRPLRTKLPEIRKQAEEARKRGRARLRRREPAAIIEGALEGPVAREVTRLPPLEEFRRRQEETVEPAPAAHPADNPSVAELQKLADISLREFNSQLYIIQEMKDA